jgi:hypothetical protein
MCNKKKFLKRTTSLHLNKLAVQRAFIEGKSSKYIHSILISKNVKMTTMEQYLLRFRDFTKTIHAFYKYYFVDLCSRKTRTILKWILNRMRGRGLHASGSRQGKGAGSCENVDDPLYSIH